jgi:FKBP-type peptidyl-prolyl cis-trans isomerase
LANYIAEQKITVTPTESGLYYIETLKGKGAKAEEGKQVTVHYTGKFLDGTVFDSSVERGVPYSFKLEKYATIEGFSEGILLMREGGKATLILPSEIAYGDGGGRFPPYVSLIFEVELIKVSDPVKPSESPLN